MLTVTIHDSMYYTTEGYVLYYLHCIYMYMYIHACIKYTAGKNIYKA